MKHTILTTAFSLALASPFAFAQQPQAPADAQQPPAPITRSSPSAPPDGSRRPRGDHRRQPNPHRETLMLSRRLNLTPDQTAKIEPILADRQQKLDALRANTSLTPDEFRRQMGELRRNERVQMQSILTPEQQEQMKSMRHGRGQFRGQPPQAS